MQSIYYDPVLGKVVVVQAGEAFGTHRLPRSNVQIEDKANLGKLLVSIEDGNYLVAREEYTAPANPTFQGIITGYGSVPVSIICSTSGATIRYTINGEAPTASTGTVYSGQFSVAQITSAISTEYTIRAIAVKNGIESEVVTRTITVLRQVAAPAIAVSGNNYSTSRTITISCATTGAAIQYRYNTSDNWQNYTEPIVINDSKTIYTKATLADWGDNEANTSIQVGRNKCYIGQTATLTTESDIKAITNSYEQDTLIGSTKSVDLGSTAEYVWFCLPNTTARNLTVKSDGFAVPLQAAAGSTIGAYRVWRTESKLNGTFNFEIN